MTGRRTFLRTLVGSIFARALGAIAQPASKVPVVGVLGTVSMQLRGQTLSQLRRGLSDLGYVEGQNILVVLRSPQGKPEKLSVLAAEIVRLNPDVIYAIGPPAVRAARDATATIPIVAFDLETDPVQGGLVSSLSRPGANLTGLFLDLPGLAGKWLELLKQAAPGIRRVGLVWDSTAGSSQLVAARAAAQVLAIDVEVLEVRSPDDLDTALNVGAGGGLKALAVLSSPILDDGSKHIADFAIKNRLPAISLFRSFTNAGGLMSYGPNLLEFRLRAAGYVDRILKGAKPGDLPIEQPTKFEFVINLKTAKTLGLTIPQELLLRADEVIQ